MNRQANYLLFDSVARATKIGISHTPGGRQQTLLSQRYAIQVLFYAYLPNDSPKKIETGLHDEYKAKRLQGEWFSLSFADIECIIGQLSREGSRYSIDFNALSYAKSLLDNDAEYHLAGDMVNHPFFVREEKLWREKLKKVEALQERVRAELRKAEQLSIEKLAIRQEIEKEMRCEFSGKYERYWQEKVREAESNALMAKRIGKLAWSILWDEAELKEQLKKRGNG